jgi:hypothetical protein
MNKIYDFADPVDACFFKYSAVDMIAIGIRSSSRVTSASVLNSKGTTIPISYPSAISLFKR